MHITVHVGIHSKVCVNDSGGCEQEGSHRISLRTILVCIPINPLQFCPVRLVTDEAIDEVAFAMKSNITFWFV
jgi:hypothetical protein